jgi:hypothetical protein
MKGADTAAGTVSSSAVCTGNTPFGFGWLLWVVNLRMVCEIVLLYNR